MFSSELFGQRLREARKRAGETQTEVGELIGVKKSQISEMENGSTSTTVEKVVLLCKHFQVSSDY